MNTTITSWILAAAGACAFLAAGALLDGHSEAEVERLTAIDLLDAQHSASLDAVRLDRCRALRGPRAEVVLAGINGQDFVCRVKDGV